MSSVEETAAHTHLEWDTPLFRTAIAQFEQAVPYADVSEAVAERLRYPERALMLSVPVKMDDGTRARLRGLPRPALVRARADEGRHPLRPGGDARRVRRARGLDDLEVRAAAPPVRRRQGRRPLQSAPDVDARARAPDAPLHLRAPADHRPAGGHPGARHGDERADDGLDDGHLLDAGRLRRAGDRHGQADLDRRLGLPARGDRRRGRDGDRARVRAARLERSPSSAASSRASATSAGSPRTSSSTAARR